jgi:putative transposase
MMRLLTACKGAVRKEPRSYPIDLTGEEWTVLKPPIPRAKPSSRLRTRERASCSTRHSTSDAAALATVVPHGFPPWQTAYHYYRLWHLDGT